MNPKQEIDNLLILKAHIQAEHEKIYELIDKAIERVDSETNKMMEDLHGQAIKEKTKRKSDKFIENLVNSLGKRGR